DKSGVSPNTISVPKGPGSIEGLGESFQPSLNTGTAKYGLGLVLPPGTAGRKPSLALSYEGGGGNGLLGYSWSLPLPCIQRRSDKGIPTYGADAGFPRADIFINEMREELVPRADGFWFCENEGAFIRYRQAGDHWEGTLPDGTKLEFGLSATGRIEDAATARVFCWLLERETDTRGNVIEYGYAAFSGDANLNQKYLTLIRYGPGGPPWTHYHFAAFQYEDRPDWFEDARAGFLVRTGKRLKTIHVGTQGVTLPGHATGDFDGDGTPDALNRRYDLEYLCYAGDASHWSLLERVTMVGADGVTAFPPARFGYTVCDPPPELSARDYLIGAIDEPVLVMDNEFVDLLDVNADGFPDVLRTELGGQHTACLNQGPARQNGQPAIRWSAPRQMDQGNGSAWNFDLASERTHLADMDGDGLADLVHTAADEAVFYFTNLGRLAWSDRREMSIQNSAPPAPFGHPEVRMTDLDFDKRIDVIQSEQVGNGIQYRIWFNLGAQRYSPPIVVEPTFRFPFSRLGVQIADCNGDRVPDVARVQPDSVVVAAGLGYGRFAEPRNIAIPGATLDDLQVTKAKLSDINGDGLADLVLERATPGTCWYWLNLGNYTFGPRKRISDLPIALAETAAVRWADLNGNGTTDLIYADRQATPRLQAVEIGELLNCAPAPNVLIRIENGIGSVTRIEYAPSTQFALEDAAAGRAWPQALPFPVTVVSNVTVSDSLGHQFVTRFRYHDGYYDPVEKQFRGFARAEQISVGDPSAPTLVSRSHFDTGYEFEAMKGKLLRLTTETEDGAVFSDETTTWTTPPKTLMTGVNGQAVRFAHPKLTVKEVLELGRGAPQRLESEIDFDPYGNQVFQANYGIVESGSRFAFDDERITVTEYALNLGAWIIRFPKRQTIQDETGAVISRSESFYDDETFSGNNLGRIAIGNLTLKRDWIDPADPAAFVESARSKYDRYGNAVALFDPLHDGTGNPQPGHSRELTYDAAFHSYPIRETIHVGNGQPALLFQAAYDEGLGTVVRSTDFNGNTTQYGYDALARLISLVRPGDSEDFPTAEYRYALAVPAEYRAADSLLHRDGLVNYVETRQRDQVEIRSPKSEMYLISRQFTDGLGRALMTRGEAEPTPGSDAPRVVVSGAVLFNARLKPVRVLNPFFTLRSGSVEELLAFENIELPGWQGQFHEAGALVARNLDQAHQASNQYDATLRLIRATNPDGTAARTEFEPLVTRAFDENDTDPASPHFNTPMVQHTDGLGRLFRVDEIVRRNDDGTPATALQTWTTRYEYDLNDRLTRITDSQNNVKRMRYDGLRRKVWMNDPDMGLSTNLYDAASNLIEMVDAKGQRITYTYDGLNRLLTEDFHDDQSQEFSYQRTPDVVYHYDAPPGPVDQGNSTLATARNTKGLLAFVEDPSGEEHSSFDARGRVEWTVKRVPDPLLTPNSELRTPNSLVSYKTAFAYDSLDRVTRMIYPDNDEVTYRYNARSLIEGISGGPSGHILAGLSYLPSAQQASIDYGNGVRTTYEYDARLRLSRLFTQHAARNTELVHFRYDFDPVSNIGAVHDARPLSAVALQEPRRNTQLFQYDDLYRLTQVLYNPSTLASEASPRFIKYRYDRIGNLLAQTSDIAHLENGRSVTDLGAMSYGGAAGSSHRQGRVPNDPPGPHALTRISNLQSQMTDRNYSYDANGNMTQIDGLKCTWDFRDRLVALEDHTMRAEYRYDYTGRRIIKRVRQKEIPPGTGMGRNAGAATTDNGPLTTLYLGKHFEVREHDHPTKYVFNGSTRIARVTGSLSANMRTQRFRVRPGWNLLSLAVSAPNALRQMTNSQFSILNSQSVVRWNQPTLTWLAVSPDETLPAGAILWLKASTNATLALTGPYSDPANRPLPAGASFLPSAGLEQLPLLGERAAVRADVALWHFDANRQIWENHLPAIPVVDLDFPKTLSPGAAILAHAEAPAELIVPDAALRLRYYHQDHLGSSSVMTDAGGALVEETAFYPFGETRHEHRLRPIEEDYQFTQKERDRESGLHYFEARYLAGSVARFVSADPKYAELASLPSEGLISFLSQPQALNLYSYAANNPLKYTDPSGMDVWIPFYHDLDELDVGATASAMLTFSPATFTTEVFLPNSVVQAKNSVGQIALGAMSCLESAGAGCALAAHGLDQLQAQIRGTRPLTAQRITAVTGSEAAGDWGNLGVGIVLSFGTKMPTCDLPRKANPLIDPLAATGTADPALAATGRAASASGTAAGSTAGSWRAQQSAADALFDANTNHIMQRINGYQKAYGTAPPQQMVNQFIREADELFPGVDRLLNRNGKVILPD
ncbi:MAG: FG-GAP-like repeat-containing protein, partial [Verrucomicrobiales bacterium]|nr:FG-GAP-like repeat-containing protein [Verrucomicrobiales bacterium]